MQIPKLCFIFNVPGSPIVRRLVLRPPQGWPKRAVPRTVLSFLDGHRWRGSKREAEEELTRRIEAACCALPWPRLTIIRKDSSPDDPHLDHPLIWCIAASKATGDILLLDRRPNLEKLWEAEPIVLHFPDRRCV